MRVFLGLLLSVTKLPVFTKLGVLIGVLLAASPVIGDLPVQNGWFDAFSLVTFAAMARAIVGGEPEPDVIRKVTAKEMSWHEFYYLWFYRSSHLFLISPTAYNMHPEKFGMISGAKDSNSE